MTRLTPRQINWLEGTGAHIGSATKQGLPTVIVAEKALVVNESIVTFELSAKQIELIRTNIAENPRVSLAPGGIGAIRAAYQFKGNAQLKNSTLEVEVDEVYSTKPGPEAGLRLDNLPYEDVIKFEKSRWADDGPPR